VAGQAKSFGATQYKLEWQSHGPPNWVVIDQRSVCAPGLVFYKRNGMSKSFIFVAGVLVGILYSHLNISLEELVEYAVCYWILTLFFPSLGKWVSRNLGTLWGQVKAGFEEEPAPPTPAPSTPVQPEPPVDTPKRRKIGGMVW